MSHAVTGETALWVAASTNRLDILKLLLAQPLIDIDYANTDGLTPLMIAVHFGYLDLVEELLSAGADLHKTDNSGMTALGIAQTKDHTQVITLLESAYSAQNHSP